MEIWKDIEGYEGLYQVSNLGKVKSLPRYKRGKLGSLISVKEIICKQRPNKKGYCAVTLHKDKKGKTLVVHRLVAKAFIPNPDNLPQVNHKDEDKTNNVVFFNEDGTIDYDKSNLEWCTNKYNVNYGTRNERASLALSKALKGKTYSDETKRKMSEAKSIKVGAFKSSELIMVFKSMRDADNYGFNHSLISNAIKKNIKHKGYEWRCVS